MKKTLQTKKQSGTFIQWLLCAVILLGFSATSINAQTTTTITCTGSAGSFASGSVSSAGVKNDGNLVNLNTGQNRGWAHFDLSSIPAGVTVTAVTLNATSFSSTGSSEEMYGFTGNPQSIAGATLYTNCVTGSTFYSGGWTANAANSITFNAAGVTFIQANITTNNANISFVKQSASNYNFQGYSGSPAPTLAVTYTTPPTKLAITTINPASPIVATAFSVTVQSQDAGSVAQSVTANTNITLSVASGPGTISGTTTGTINNGTNNVVIAGVTLSAAGTYTLTATRTSGNALTPGTSASFVVTLPATQLTVIAISPASPFVSTGFSITVQSRDASNVATNVTSSTNVSLSVASGPGTIGGTTTGTITNGTNSVTISGVTLNTPGTYTITVTRTSGMNLTAGTSPSFVVQGQLGFSTITPASPQATVAFSAIVQSQDNSSTPTNVNANTNVTLSVASGPGTIGGTTTGTINNGTNSVTISGITLSAAGVYTLLATRTSGIILTPGTSSSIVVLVAPPTPIFRTIATGNWTTLSTWESSINGGVSYTAATVTPTAANSDGVQIRNGHTVTLNSNLTIDDVVIDAGGTLSYTSSTLTIANGAAAIDFNVNGTVTNTSTNPIITNGAMAFGAGGTYNHNVTGSAIPLATWNATSTCNNTGTNGTAPANLNQTFGNFIWNCGNQGGNINLNTSITTLGDFSLLDMNGNRLVLAGDATNRVLTVGGNFTQSSDEFRLSNNSGSGTINCTGNFNVSNAGTICTFVSDVTNCVVTVGGNVNVTGGTLRITEDNGTGTLNVGGNFTHTGGTISRSNGTANIIFNKVGAQVYTSGGTYNSAVNITVNSTSMLQFANTSFIPASNTGTFTVQAGGILGLTSAGGISITGATGNVQSTGTRTYTTGASFVYNGNVNQVTGLGLSQNTPLNVTINNNGTSGNNTVTMSAAYTLSGLMQLALGILDCSASNFGITLTGGNWLNNGGSLFTTGRTGVVTFNSTSVDQSIMGTATNQLFNSMTIAKSGTKLIIVDNDGVGPGVYKTTIGATLTMTSGNIQCENANTFELGTSTAAVGTLTYTSGNIVGQFKRWINSTGTGINFPVGTLTSNRKALVTFTNLTNGSLTANFIAFDGGANGLPLSEAGFSVTNQMSEGYWSLTAANSLASTNYALELTGTGFVSQTEDANTRIIKRSASGNPWTLDGTHVTAATSIAKRSGLSGFSEFAHAKAVCTALPVGSASPQSICSGTASSVALNSDLGSTTFTWTASLLSGTVSGFANCASSCGTSIAQTLTNPSNSVAGVVRYTVTPTAFGGCVGSNFTVDVTVNPKPAGSASPASVCSGTSAGVTLNSTLGGTTFSWSGAQLSGSTVTGFGSGTGSPIGETLTNTSNSTNGVVRYTITPTSGAGCAGTNFTVDVTVKPTPVGSSTGGEYLCNGDMTTVGLSTTTSGTSTFTWTAAGSSGNIAGYSDCSSSCGNNIGQTISNSGTGDESVVYTITPTSALGCTGNTFAVTETFGATPVASASNQTICSGAASAALSSTVASTDFTWTSIVISGTVTGNNDCPGGCGSTINDVLINTGATDAVVEYTVSSTSPTGCPGANIVVDVTVQHGYNIVATASGTGVVTPAGTTLVCVNTDQTYAITPNGGSHIVDVLIDGISDAGAIGSGTYTFVNVTTTHTISATFALNCTAPTFTVCPGTQSANTATGLCNNTVSYTTTTAGTTPTVSYSFSGATTGSGSGDGSGSTFNRGTTAVSVTATNGCGTTNCNFNVIVTDNQAPATPTLADVTGECSATATAPTTTDNCTGTVTGTTTNALSYSTQGTHVITWTFDDGNGNSTTANQNVIVDDITAPVTPTLADVTGECSATATAPTTTDNCTGTVTGTTTNALSYSTQGTHVITWTFDDGNGNSTTANQNVIVDDITAPATPTLADVTGECSATATAPTTTDNCTGTVTGTTTNALSYSTQGTHVITWTFDDGNGNSTTAMQNVIVDDVTAPATPTLADATGECSATATAPTTTDNCAGTITGTTADALSYSTQGTHVITWTFDDGNGNSTTAMQNVIVDDITAPATPTLADATGECSATATAPTTTDNCAGTITGTTTDALSYSTQGTHVITWTFDDGNGNSTTANQNVIVDDITAPATPTLADVTGECSATATAPTTTDNCSGTITGTTTNALSYSTQGTHVITWTFDDGNGNSTTANQNVIITDTQNPTITAPADVTVCSGGSVTLGTPTTADNCTVASVTNNAPGTYPLGNTLIVWTVTDEAGHIATANQNVTVNALPVGSASDITICNGDPSNLPLNSSIAGSSFTWTSTVTTGTVVGNGSCSSGCSTSITDVLTNIGTVHGVVQYTIIPTAPGGCVGASFTANVTVGAAPAAPVISGPSVVCALTSTTYSVVAVPEATSYIWTVPTGTTGMTITGGQGTTAINVNISAGTVTGNVTCTAVNNCGNSPTTSLAVTKKPAIPGAITGPTSTCGLTNATYSIASVFGATSYAWTVPANTAITSGQGTTTINVTMTASFVYGQVKVSAVNACGNIPGTAINVTGNVPTVPVSITGPANVCGLSTASYSVPAVAGATGYSWSITGAGTIVGSNTGTSVTVALNGTTGGSISCAATNVCGNGTPKVLNLTVAAIQAGLMTGPTSICGTTTATYSVASVGANYTYNWSLTLSGWSITSGQGSTSITITGPATGTTASGLVRVTTTNTCGSTSAYRTTAVTYCHNAVAMNNGAEAVNNMYSNIYPNPTSSDFTIDVTSDLDKDVIVEVYDILGNLVIHELHQVVIGTNTMKTNIENYKNGMYFVRLLDTDSNVIHSQTVIKQ